MEAKPDITDGPGKLKNGFNMTARDLDRAFALAFLGGYEAFVLQNAREGCWTAAIRTRRKGEPMPEPRPHRVNLTQLAKDSGMCRQLLSRGINDLIKAKILDRFNDGSVVINKDYRAWVFPATKSGAERPRFSSTQLDYIKEASAKNGTHPCNSQVAPPATQELHPLQPTGCTPCNPQVAPPATHRLHPHIEERVRGNRELEREDKSNTESVDVLKFGSPPQSQEPAPEYPEGDGGMYEITPSTYPMGEGRARQIFRMLWAGWSNRRMCFDFYQRQQFYQDEIWIAAIRNAKQRDVAVGSLHYIEKIAADYQANGIPKPKPAQAGSRASSPKSIPLEYKSDPEFEAEIRASYGRRKKAVNQ